MVGRSASALMKRAQMLAAKGDDSMIELAEVVWDLRALPKPPDGNRPTLDGLASRMKLSRRTICYVVKVWQALAPEAMPPAWPSATISGASYRGGPTVKQRMPDRSRRS
jgi:hypothetical protein